VWLSEHHLFEDGYLPQPLTFAAAIAARTRHVRIGTAILIAPLRRAAQILEEASLVDQISTGRLELGLGAGYRQPEYALFGVEPARPMGVLFDRFDELRQLMKEGHVTPPPSQTPLPIWIGSNGPRGARRAGRLGAPLLSAHIDLVPEYRSGLEEGGFGADAARMAGPVNLFLSHDPERAWPAVARYFSYLWDSYNRASVEGTDKPAPVPVDPERFRARGLGGGMGGILVGTPSDAADQIRKHFRDSPIETIFCWGWLPGIADDLVERHLDLLFGELAPLLA
jgi:alkanesulfonate monooxygenase SsuD/methylene tetrahydromethanopterin reductase-like flavin-dependent oxidoreductase (luciferase family)